MIRTSAALFVAGVILASGCQQAQTNEAPLPRVAKRDDSVRSLGEALFLMQSFDKAEDRAQVLAKLLEHDPGCVHAWLWKGDQHVQLGQRELANECFQRAYALNPEATTRYVEWLNDLLSMASPMRGDPKEHAARVARFLARNPDDPIALYDLALIKYDAGDYAESARLLDRALGIGLREDIRSRAEHFTKIAHERSKR